MNRRQIFLHGNNDILRTSSALWICALFAMMCLLGFSRITRADMGPKPNIRIDVENPPSGDYYIALLSRDGSGENGSDWAGKVMEKVGMKKEGVHRQAGRNNRGLFDLVFWAKLKEDR